MGGEERLHAGFLWLKFDMADRNHMAILRCTVCSQFKEKLASMSNFQPAFIKGTTNVQTSMMMEDFKRSNTAVVSVNT